jgi:hypothetical protein
MSMLCFFSSTTRDILLAKKEEEGNLIHAITEVNILPMPTNIDY